MNIQKRHIGRAIRKQRRKQRELLAAVSAIDLEVLGTSMVRAFDEMASALSDAAERAAALFTEFGEVYADSIRQEHRMTHMALTTGKERDE